MPDASFRLHDDIAQDLIQLRLRLLEMGGRVEAMIGQATRAVVERDVELARRTVQSDRAVNTAEIQTDGYCLAILARHHPHGRDLRFLTLTLKMVTDLERIGDLAVNLSERAVDLAPLPPSLHAQTLERMGELASWMVREALDAFVAGDELRAHAVLARDDEMDELYDHFFADVLADMLARSDQVRLGVQLQAAAKYYERIGDHSTNLAEHVLFLVRGEDVRHRGKRPLE